GAGVVGAAVGDVGLGSGQAVGPPLVAAAGEAAAEHPAVGAVAGTHAVLVLEAGLVAVQLFLNPPLDALAVFGVDAPEPLVDAGADLRVLLAQHGLPARR